MADKMGNGASKNVTLPENGSAHLNISSADIRSMHLDGQGGLVITLKDGSVMPTIKNFQALAHDNASIALSDGNTIDTGSLSHSLAAKHTAAIHIEKPEAGETVSMDLQRGHDYVLPDLKGATMVEKGGALIITFDAKGDDKSVLILDHIASVTKGAHAAHLVYEGKTFSSLHQFETAMHIHHNGHELASMDDAASKLANQEPGAGTPTGALAASAGGYGFQSSVAAAELFGRPPIGPIDPTDLAFGLPAFDHKLYALEPDQAPVTPPSIIITVNGSGNIADIPDAVVKENGTIDVPLTAQMNNAKPGEGMTVVVSGIPSNVGTVTPHDGGVYDAAAGTITYTLAPGQNLGTVITFAPSFDSDVDFGQMHVSATAMDPVSGIVSSQVDFYVTTDAVAEVPTIDATNATDEAGKTTALHISGAPTDPDGSESITKFTVSGLPAGATLNHGTQDANGVWTLTPAEAADLSITVPKTTATGTYSLIVTDYNEETTLSGKEVDFSDNTNHNQTTLVLTVTPNGIPVITSTGANGNGGDNDLEHAIGTAAATVTDHVTFTYGTDGAGTIAANGTFTSTGSEANGKLTSDGQPVTVTRDGNTYTGHLADGGTVFTLVTDSTGTYTFTLDKPLDHAATGNDQIALNFGVTVTDSDGDTASGTITINIVDDVPVAHNDVNSFTTGFDTTTTGNVVTGAGENAGGADTLSKDVPNAVTMVSFNGNAVAIPATGTATIAGANGVLTIAADGSYTYKLSHAGASDVFNYTLKDNDGDTSTATLTVANTNTPTVIVTVNGSSDLAHIPDAVVKEDHSIDLPVTAKLVNPSSASEALTVVVSGIPSTVGTVVPHDGGVYNAANGTITYILAPGAALNTTITLTPAPNSDIDFGSLTVTATAQDVNTGAVSASGTVYVTTDAVADVPTISASPAPDEAGRTVALAIGGAVTDTDGSEIITKFTVSGLPAGATLNHGTQGADGTWTLSPADVTGLTITVPKTTTTGTYSLIVTDYNEESKLSGREADFSDNTNHNQTTLVLTVTPNGVPVITSTGSVNGGDRDLEHDIGTAAATITDKVTFSYGTDGPGKIAANGTFSATGSEANGKLTSDGHDVTVTRDGNTYTGHLADGSTVFSLAMDANGAYTFTLDKPLDHAVAGNDQIALHFGVTVTDIDGDTATGTIDINVVDDVPVAHNDVNNFFSNTGVVSGNVVTGAGEVAGGADTLSKDVPNHVTAVSFNGHDVAVPATGTASIQGDHGTLTIAADGSYTYASTNASTTTIVDTPHVFSGNTFPTDLAERQALSAADQGALGELRANMTVAANTTVTGQISYNGATYANSLGAFTVTADGTLQSAQMVVSNASQTGGTFTATAGSSASEIGFFLIANGANTNKAYAGLDFSKGSLAFTYDYGLGDARGAKVTDDGSKVTLVFTDASGHETVLNGPIYFTSDRGGSNSLNGDGMVHTVSGIDGTDTSTLKIGFEDLTGKNSDRDYNDTEFTVKLTDHTVTNCDCGADQFGYTLTDQDGDNSKATLSLNCTTAPAVVVTINGSSDLTHIPDAVVKEDHSIDLPLTAKLTNPSSASEALTVVVSGIPANVGMVTPHDGGVYNAANGTITYTLQPGASLDTTIGFTPKANSDVDFGSLTVTASAHDATTGTVSASGTVYVTTDAVADVPTISAQAATDEAGHSAALVITGGVTDMDGSETITKFTVSGLPAGATLNHGTHDANGVYTLTPTELAGLTVSVPKGTAAGTYNLTVTDYNQESKLSGKEADTSDNTNHNQTTLVLTVSPNGTPVVTPSGNAGVLEHDIGTAAATVTGKTTVTSPDATGAVTANGTFTADGSEAGGKLTSGGQPVTVAHTDTGYVGTTPDGSTVFTLTLTQAGDYTFTLNKPFDDAVAGKDTINLHFGVSSTASAGDTGSGTITVTVTDDVPVAHNDVNNVYATGSVSGNVVTGAGEVAGGADTLSKDTPNHVTAVSFNGHDVAVPTTGTASIQGDHGILTIAADGSYTYASTSASTTTITDTPHVFTGNAFPTDLAEHHELSVQDRTTLGELHSNMTVNANTAVTGQITFDGANYTNSLGTYTITADGTLQAAQLIAPSINQAGATFTAAAGSNATELGFFLIANGAVTNHNYAGLDFSKGTLAFTYDYGQGDARGAKVTDDGSKVSLVFTDASGHATVLNGPIYFTSDRGGSNALNSDGLIHTISGTNGGDTSTLKIGFEDLPCDSSDRDFNDTVFTVKLTDHTVTNCGCGADQFGYTLTDSDGDNSKATLSLNCTTPPSVVVTVNGSSDLVHIPDAVVKEDHSIDLPLTAKLLNPSSASEALTVVVSGIPANVGTVTPHDGGVYSAANGTITYTLQPGANLDTTIGFTPKANSDVDFGSLTVTASAHDAVTGNVSASGNVYVTTDAVVDTPVLTAPDSVNYKWYIDYNSNSGTYGNNPTALAIGGHVTDTDGSEQINKITIDLTHPFSNPSGQYDSLADTGVTVNLGTQTAPGIYTINVNAQDAANALNGLKLTTPSTEDYYWALHNGPHSGTIEVKEYVSEAHLSGKEADYSDNSIVVTKEINYTFAVSPLIVDLNHNGFDIVNQSAGVKFDMTNDGLADKTSWVAPTDGFLAMDANHNGVIDNQSELFGDGAGARDGFAKLAVLDSNHDGVINARDSAFDSLTIWQDANQDGVSQASELHGLTQEGITAISLTTVAANTAVGDSFITDVATVTFMDGHTSQIGDAWFNVADASLPNTGVREDGTSGNDVLYGTDNSDVLAGHGGNDTLTGGKGADIFVFAAASGVAHITDFNAGEGDQIDLSALLHKFDPVTEAINSFVFTKDVNGSTVISIDQGGSGNAANATQVAVLDHIAGLSTDELLHHAVVKAAA